MANGRCYMHGGRTPRQDQWHVLQLPDGSTPKSLEKGDRKFRDHQARAGKRAARVSCMSAEEREKHLAWQRTHKPGSAAARKREREFRRQNTEAKLLIDAEPSERLLAPELKRVEAELEFARAELARLTKRPG